MRVSWRFLTSLLLVAVAILPTVQFAVAQSSSANLPSVIIYPDNPFYPLKRNAFEPLQVAFYSLPEGKVGVYLSQAGARIVELQAMIRDGKSQYTNDLTTDYQAKVDAANRTANEIRDNDTRAATYESVQSATQTHIQVLERVIQVAPPQAQAGLQNALKKSQHEQQIVAVHLAERNNQRTVTHIQVSVSTASNGQVTFVTQTSTVDICQLSQQHAKVCRTTTTTTTT